MSEETYPNFAIVLRKEVASNPSTPARLLDELAQDQEARVRRAVAANPNTSWETLEQLAEAFPHEFLHNPTVSSHLFSRWEQINKDEEFWEAVLRVEQVPSYWWSWLMMQPTLRKSSGVRMHVRIAGEVSYPFGTLQDSDEHILSTLTALLGHFFPRVDPLTAQDPGAPLRFLGTIGERVLLENIRTLAQSSVRDVKVSLAMNPHTPPAVLRQLARESRDFNVWLHIAQHPQVPKETLAYVEDMLEAQARDENSYYRGYMARNPQTPARVLQELARDTEKDVRGYAARNPRTPVRVLQELARDTETWVRFAVAENPQTPADLLQLLARDTESWLRAKVARHPQALVLVLQVLATDADAGVRQAVARHPRTPTDVVHKLAHDNDKKVREAVAENLHAPAAVLQEVAGSQDKKMREMVARHPKTPIHVLRELSHDADKWVRYAVAGNLQTPEEILTVFATDTEWSTRRRVAMHPHLPVSGLASLLHDSHPTVCQVARTIQTLWTCFEHSSREEARESIFLWLLQLQRLSAREQLECIAIKEVPEAVRQAVTAVVISDWNVDEFWIYLDPERDNHVLLFEAEEIASILSPANLPALALEQFSQSSYWQVRYLIALHEKTPLETRRALSHDGNRYVRAAARLLLHE